MKLNYNGGDNECGYIPQYYVQCKGEKELMKCIKILKSIGIRFDIFDGSGDYTDNVVFSIDEVKDALGLTMWNITETKEEFSKVWKEAKRNY